MKANHNELVGAETVAPVVVNISKSKNESKSQQERCALENAERCGQYQ